MKRMLIKISYDGTDYHGWQLQPNAVTVQETVENALEKLMGAKVRVAGCSRTDAGVHANEFCFHLDCEEKFPENAFLFGLNSLLPSDIRVIACSCQKNDFHARYNAKGKRYIYRMYLGKENPFLSRYSLFLQKAPNIRLMNKFCKRIVGKHDFAGFASSGRTVEDTVRTVKKCSVFKKRNELYFVIEADGFLYNMVRILAGTALFVGYKKLKFTVADDVFASCDRSLAGDTLAPHGLILDEVFY